MKYFLLPTIVGLLFLSCRNSNSVQVEKTEATKLNYPFRPGYSINWQPGDEKNALIVLNSLKKYTAGDLKGAFENYADTVTFLGDNFYFKGKKDSLIKIFAKERREYASLTEDFDSWITVYYPDKKCNWVSVWFTEKWTDKKGVKDSLYYTDDVLVKDGKITEYDEKIRHFVTPSAKK